MRARRLGSLLATTLALFAGCTCSHAKDSGKDGGREPPLDGGARGSLNPDAAMTPREQRDWGIRINHELCEAASKRLNTLAGKPETDPNSKALYQLSLCLQVGNVAWYKCVLDAPSTDALEVCSKRFLFPH